MQIQELLSIHSAFRSPRSHADILGDAYLLEHNSVYRNIKLHALEIGCHYQEAWPEYLLLPFHQLGHIVANKIIPYVPARRLLQSVEDKRANALSIDDMHIPESYHLHEAAHVIAEEVFAGVEFSTPHQKILKFIVCESFANAVDAHACALVQDETHYIFMRQNSYMHPEKKSALVLRRLTKALGSKFAFVSTLVCYLHANFLRELIPPTVLQELVARYAGNGCEWTDKVEKDFEALRKMAERLDPQFRVQTTQMFLNLEGFDGDVFEILDFEFMPIFMSQPKFQKAVVQLFEIVAGERSLR